MIIKSEHNTYLFLVSFITRATETKQVNKIHDICNYREVFHTSMTVLVVYMGPWP